MLIVAGPGAGKTLTLTRRAARLAAMLGDQQAASSRLPRRRPSQTSSKGEVISEQDEKKHPCASLDDAPPQTVDRGE